MGFTVADMMLIGTDKFEMKLIAGESGGANSISWLLMVEDTTIMQNFNGKELAVTTGVGFGTEERLCELVNILSERHAAGLIVNTGYYVKTIPEAVINLANEKDLPLITVPWNIQMSEMIKDLTVRIFLQTETDEQISAAFINAIENSQDLSQCRDKLSANFDVDGQFQVLLFSTQGLDSMDTMDRKRIGYRLQIYLEKISHNAHFFYYDGAFVLILNAVSKQQSREIIDGFMIRAQRRMPDKTIYLGEGSLVEDIYYLHTSYARALYALKCAMKNNKTRTAFDDLGMERLLYSISDELICSEMCDSLLRPLIEYDEKHKAQLCETLYLYLKHNGSVQAVAGELFAHKNTVVYRIAKIKELLGDDLETGEKRLYYYIACITRKM